MNEFKLVSHPELGTVFKNDEGMEIQAVSSLYLVDLIKTLSKTDPSVTPKKHKNVLRDIRSASTSLHSLKLNALSRIQSEDSGGSEVSPQIAEKKSRLMNIESQYDKYLMIEGTYVDVRGKTVPLACMSPDMCLLAMSGYSLSIRAQIINDLRVAERHLNKLTGVDIPPATVEGYLPGTEEFKLRKMGYESLLSSMKKSYFSVFAVLEEYLLADASNTPIDFFTKFPMVETMEKLESITSEFNMEVKQMMSASGHRSPLYHYTVLLQVFGKEIDLFSLDAHARELVTD